MSNLPYMLPTKFWFIWPSGFRREDFQKSANQNKNCLWRTCLLKNRAEMTNLDKGPSINASFQVLIHLAKRLQRRRFFRNRPIRKKNFLWRPLFLLTDRDEMKNIYRGHYIDASYQVSVHSTMQFQRNVFRNRRGRLRTTALNDVKI